MSKPPNHARISVRAALKIIRRGVLIAFFVVMAALPLPMLPFVALLLKPVNRNLPAEIVRRRRKKE